MKIIQKYRINIYYDWKWKNSPEKRRGKSENNQFCKLGITDKL